MSSHRIVMEKYLAQLAGVNVNTVRRYVKVLSSLVRDYDLFSARKGSAGE